MQTGHGLSESTALGSRPVPLQYAHLTNRFLSLVLGINGRQFQRYIRCRQRSILRLGRPWTNSFQYYCKHLSQVGTFTLAYATYHLGRHREKHSPSHQDDFDFSSSMMENPSFSSKPAEGLLRSIRKKWVEDEGSISNLSYWFSGSLWESCCCSIAVAIFTLSCLARGST